MCVLLYPPLILTCPQFLQWCRRRVSVKVFEQEWQVFVDPSGTQVGRSIVIAATIK